MQNHQASIFDNRIRELFALKAPKQSKPVSMREGDFSRVPGDILIHNVRRTSRKRENSGNWLNADSDQCFLEIVGARKVNRGEPASDGARKLNLGARNWLSRAPRRHPSAASVPDARRVMKSPQREMNQRFARMMRLVSPLYPLSIL
jgi:hypothetical protein